MEEAIEPPGRICVLYLSASEPNGTALDTRKEGRLERHQGPRVIHECGFEEEARGV